MTTDSYRNLLPMLGHTRGKRRPVTCQLKCDNACSQEICNTGPNGYFRDIAAAAITRRTLLRGTGIGAASLVLTGTALPAAAQSPTAAQTHAVAAAAKPTGLQFTPIAPVPTDVDAFTVPAGFSWRPIIRWGDRLFRNTPKFDVNAQTAAKQAQQFGYNNDYLAIMPVTGRAEVNALLVTNHEYTNDNIMFAPTTDPARLEEQRRIGLAAHGMSVVELKRHGRGQPWTYSTVSAYNRHITANTPFSFTGPAAGSSQLQTKDDPHGRTVLGTLGNCAGGTTPWDTVLSGEENFNGYFRSAGTSAADKRYGLRDAATSRLWELTDPRFDAATPAIKTRSTASGGLSRLTR